LSTDLKGLNFKFALGLLMDWDDPISVEGKGEPHQQHHWRGIRRVA